MGNTKKKRSFSKAILNLIVLVPSFFSLVRKVVTLIEFEAQLAGKNLIKLIIFSVVFGSLLTATWVGVLGMLFFYFQSLLWTPLFSLFIIFLINIVILILIALCIFKAKKNLLFPEVRNQLRYLQKFFGK